MNSLARESDVVFKILNLTLSEKIYEIINISKSDRLLWALGRDTFDLNDLQDNPNLKAVEESNYVTSIKNSISSLQESYIHDISISKKNYMVGMYDGVVATLDSNNQPTCIPPNTSTVVKTTDYDIITANAYEKALAVKYKVNPKKYVQSEYMKAIHSEIVY